MRQALLHARSRTLKQNYLSYKVHKHHHQNINLCIVVFFYLVFCFPHALCRPCSFMGGSHRPSSLACRAATSHFQAPDGALSATEIVRRLHTAGLETYLYYSVQKDEIICKIRRVVSLRALPASCFVQSRNVYLEQVESNKKPSARAVRGGGYQASSSLICCCCCYFCAYAALEWAHSGRAHPPAVRKRYRRSEKEREGANLRRRTGLAYNQSPPPLLLCRRVIICHALT